MPRRLGGKFWIGAVALAGLLVWGLAEVVLAPLDSGELYPPYSSLRSDPLGTRALFESLQELPELRVERLYKPRRTILEKDAAREKDAAIFVLGIDPTAWLAVKDATLEEYEKLVRGGGRLVLGFLPVHLRALPGSVLPIEARWGLKVHRKFGPALPGLQRDATFGFEGAEKWNVIQGERKFATAIERHFGEGSIVLAAATFPLSNEGLRARRMPEFIAKLVGPARHIWFDEEHFGVAESGSVATLIRKYRLEGPVAVLLLTAALFLWRSTTSFLPPRAMVKSAAQSGRDSLDGMASLLRRGIPRKNLIAACRAEWEKAAGREPRAERVTDELKRAESGGVHAVDAYRAAQDTLMMTGRRPR